MGNFHLYFDQPTPIFKARVNMASADYPVTSLVYDGVTLGSFSDIQPDMTLFLGTTEGAWDLGIVRVHNIPDADEIPVGRVSRGKEPGSLNIQDNAYITVLDDYRIWSKIPRMIIDPDDEETEITTYKDASVPVLNYTSEIPPIANAGPFVAGYIDPDTGLLTVDFPKDGVNLSVALAEGATIDTYDWDVADGTIIVGTSADPNITVTFPAGKRWVAHTVTDTNGVPHTSRVFVLAVDPEDDVTYKEWAKASFRLRKDGTELNVEVKKNIPRNTYPPGSLVLCWEGEAASPGDRNHMRFIGWQEQEQWSVSGTRKGMNRNTTINAVDVAGRMKVLPGFPQAIERSEEVSWETMPDPDMNRVLHYLIFWHTTAVSLVDILLPEDGELYTLLRLDTGADDIFTQAATTAAKMVPARVLTCNPGGQLSFLTDWMEVDVGDRPAAGLLIEEDDIATISANYNPQPKAHSLHAGALLAVEDWVTIGGQKTIPTLFAIAPGDAFSQGTNEVVQSEGIALSQDDLNVAAGHRYARINSPYAPFGIGFANRQIDYWQFAPAYLNRVQINLDNDYQAQRGLEWENDSEEGMVDSLTVSLENGSRGVTRSASLTWEMEVEGPAAVTHIPEEPEDPDFESPTPTPTEPPPLFGGDVQEMAGLGYDGYLYRTFDFQEATPTWERFNLSISNPHSWVVDPFSPKYLTNVGEVNGWAVNSTGIYRIEDFFGVSPSASLVHTFAEATTDAEFHWRSINASFGTYFAEGFNPWIVVVSYYGGTSGHEGTWALRSTDGGATWEDEVLISAEYSGEAATRFSPIGLYTSPKTPGLAYTVAKGLQDTTGLPYWLLWDSDTNTYTRIGLAKSYTFTESLGAGSADENWRINLCPPIDTKRVECQLEWEVVRTGAGGGAGFVLQTGSQSELDITGAENFVDSSIPVGSTGNSLVTEWTKKPAAIGLDWGGNTTETAIEPLGWVNGAHAWARNRIQMLKTGTNTLEAIITMTVLEIELEDGTIYTFPPGESVVYKSTDWGATWEVIDLFDPGAGVAGTIHFPWPDNSTEQILFHGYFNNETNREFKLFKVEAGVATDISPSDGSRSYGVGRGHFGVRTFDGDRDFVLASVIGNDTSGDPGDDMHAVYISDDGGSTWDEVVAPTADSGTRPLYEAAFSGESEQVIFIWGPSDYFGFSTDFGSTVQDKSGNLGALGHTGFVGIAGGSS